jgi:hypothetical protein
MVCFRHIIVNTQHTADYDDDDDDDNNSNNNNYKHKLFPCRVDCLMSCRKPGILKPFACHRLNANLWTGIKFINEMFRFRSLALKLILEYRSN